MDLCRVFESHENCFEERNGCYILFLECMLKTKIFWQPGNHDRHQLLRHQYGAYQKLKPESSRIKIIFGALSHKKIKYCINDTILHSRGHK